MPSRKRWSLASRSRNRSWYVFSLTQTQPCDWNRGSLSAINPLAPPVLLIRNVKRGPICVAPAPGDGLSLGPTSACTMREHSLSLAMAAARDVNGTRCEQPMIPTYVFGWPTGEETGEFLAVDLGVWLPFEPFRAASQPLMVMGASAFSRGKVERTCVCASSLCKARASSRSRNQSTAFRKNKSRTKAKSCSTFAPSASRRSSTPILTRPA